MTPDENEPKSERAPGSAMTPKTDALVAKLHKQGYNRKMNGDILLLEHAYSTEAELTKWKACADKLARLILTANYIGRPMQERIAMKQAALSAYADLQNATAQTPPDSGTKNHG